MAKHGVSGMLVGICKAQFSVIHHFNPMLAQKPQRYYPVAIEGWQDIAFKGERTRFRNENTPDL